MAQRYSKTGQDSEKTPYDTTRQWPTGGHPSVQEETGTSEVDPRSGIVLPPGEVYIVPRGNRKSKDPTVPVSPEGLEAIQTSRTVTGQVITGERCRQWPELESESVIVEKEGPSLKDQMFGEGRGKGRVQFVVVWPLWFLGSVTDQRTFIDWPSRRGPREQRFETGCKWSGKR